METKWGVIDTNGQFIIEPKYDSIGSFYDGCAKFKVNGKWGYIDSKGCVIIQPQYDKVAEKLCDYTYVKDGDKFYYINKLGKKVIGPLFVSNCGSFNEDRAIATKGEICGKYCKWGYIDLKGNFVIDPLFLIDPLYEQISSFKNGFAIVKNLQGFWCVINKLGKIVKVLDIDDIDKHISNDGLLRALRGGKVGFLNNKWEWVVQPKQFERCGLFQEELAWVLAGGKYGFIDKKGQIILNLQYEHAWDFQEGLAPVKLHGKYGYIDKTGNFVINPQFDGASDFYGGYAYVKIDGKCGVIDRNGKVLCFPQFRKSGFVDFSEGLCRLYCGTKYGYIDKTRQLVIPPMFDDAWDFNEGLAVVGMNDCASIGSIIYSLQLKDTQPKQSNSIKSEPSGTRSTTKTSQSKKKSTSGCYIATAVYGSYDCPEVWTLRRYRDDVLDNTWYGRLFIHIYYAISPTLVKLFGKSNWFKHLFYSPLNKWVDNLNKLGFDNSPYKDKY